VMARSETSQLQSEPIELRSGEGLDQSALHDYLQGKLAGAEAPLQLRQFGGGHANLT
jgi:hypothetical protein